MEHSPPDYIKHADEMQILVESYNKHDYHPVELAARLHTDFVKIHPFVDGNGRTARLLMNFELMRNGYLPVVIEAKERLTVFSIGEYIPPGNRNHHKLVKRQTDESNEPISIRGKPLNMGVDQRGR